MTWLLLGFALVLDSFPVVTKYSDRSHVAVCRESDVQGLTEQSGDRQRWTHAVSPLPCSITQCMIHGVKGTALPLRAGCPTSYDTQANAPTACPEADSLATPSQMYLEAQTGDSRFSAS